MRHSGENSFPIKESYKSRFPFFLINFLKKEGPLVSVF
ncbi:hypothetical protein DU19_0609 [Chlamydia muridarum]|nr:hypothetical protein TAC_02930 [Chlamydia muridarum str. Nigg3 CMUT3-5]AHH24246.1 hypothetical protein Y015_02930 [Chlamydia muridarum str. Nigg CM972]KDU80780.1 hypothetical protein DU17_0611 [Chlamydia muridarum]KDU81565.1 hypothetical protein DU18_0610 [Chlamydia muridarum]KDU82095.1 hypothetical protein DU19_0609 [Chlamydia muridarum]